MPIPDYQSIMRPMLVVLSDHREHSLQELIGVLADKFDLTESERSEPLPSGFQAKFTNRCGWASTYLQKAGVIVRIGRGRYVIAQRGIDLLASKSGQITTADLEQFPEYMDFKNRAGLRPTTLQAHGSLPTTSTPAEDMDAASLVLRRSLAADVLDRVKRANPTFFELLVVDLLVRMGYGGSRADAGRAVGKSGDEGIDGIIKEDRLGLDAV